MQIDQLFLVLLALSFLVFHLAKSRAVSKGGAGGAKSLHSLPFYHGAYVAAWCFIPAVSLLFIWVACESSAIKLLVSNALIDAGHAADNLAINKIINVANGALSGESQPTYIAKAAEYYQHLERGSAIYQAVAVLLVAIAGTAGAWLKIDIEFRARNSVERIMNWLLMLCASIAIVTTVGIVLSVLFESIRFFNAVPIQEFIFGTVWSPQTALRADQIGGSGSFGAIPLFSGTLLISLIALIIAVPTGLLIALYLGEYAQSRTRTIIKPAIEMLAGIPTVVYGFIAALTVAPLIRQLGEAIGLSVSSESALAAGVVMGVMIIPFISSLSDDVINAVPQSLRDGSLALGATKSETISHVVFPAALPGIMGAILLAASRAIGETMIVVMAAGLAAKLTANPLEAVTTITVQIVTLLTGDQEFDSPKTLAAFALGLMLFVTTLALNVYALYIVRKYREQYD